MESSIRIKVFSFARNVRRVEQVLEQSGLNFVLYKAATIKELWEAIRSNQDVIALVEFDFLKSKELARMQRVGQGIAGRAALEHEIAFVS